MDNTNYAQAWFNYAQNDFEAAIILFEQTKPKFEINYRIYSTNSKQLEIKMGIMQIAFCDKCGDVLT